MIAFKPDWTLFFLIFVDLGWGSSVGLVSVPQSSAGEPRRDAKVVLERLGRFGHPPIQEASGIVASRRHPGIFWVHNDSGNPPALFAVRRDGSLVREYKVSAPNVDWEDIAIDDAGHLFLGDIGNNGLLLPLRMIYRLDEPDPAQPAENRWRSLRLRTIGSPPARSGLTPSLW